MRRGSGSTHGPTKPPPVIDYDAVYRRTVDNVKHICLAVLRNQEAADDATMDVFRKLLSNPPTRHHDNIEGWLRASARTAAIDHLLPHPRCDQFSAFGPSSSSSVSSPRS